MYIFKGLMFFQGQCVINVGGDAVFVTYPIGNHPEDGISVIG